MFFPFLVPKHLLSPIKIRIFGQKQPNFAQNLLSLAHMALRFIWCPFGWLVGGYGARAVSRKTPIYFMEMRLSYSHQYSVKALGVL